MIPLVLLVHFLFLIFYLKKLSKTFFFHFLALAIGYIFLKVTYSVSVNNSKSEGLKVLSYNVRVFNNYEHLRDENYISSKKMVTWSVENDAGVKCFQEYYNLKESDIFNVETRLKEAGWENNYCKVLVRDKASAQFGMAIFSKYPIVYKGEIKNQQDQYQNGIFADIIYNDDTIRIYNIHLKSMSIDENNVVDTDRLRRSYKETGYRLRNGFMSRAREIEALVEHMDHCPYPMILCGDFNELPYSYPYFTLRKHLNNAFEKAGNGFGFSYNGKLFFLRIDNQFYSKNLNAHDFFTHRNIDYSDHFPLTAVYTF
jgi:endonuclease/exonuclease/phosphatase family metal-dependent hydrolase